MRNVSGSEPRFLARRQSWGIGTLPADSVVIETDSSACTAALAAYRTEFAHESNFTDRVAVVRMGHLRAILRQTTGELFSNPPYVVTDSTYTTVVGLFYN